MIRSGVLLIATALLALATGGSSSAAASRSKATAIAAGGSHTCAIVSGKVKCWGSNSGGQLGNGSSYDSKTPTAVISLSGGVRAITAGDGHSCALTHARGVKCWGFDDYGQLGNGKHGEYVASGKPVNVSGLSSGVKQISAGSYFTCALTTAGRVKCWGDNTARELGGYSDIHAKPVTVPGLASGVKVIAAGSDHLCALMSTGEMKCLGTNQDGELGDGTTEDSSVPVTVFGLTGTVKAIAAGGYSFGDNTCALLSGGALYCWGFNEDGEVGDGTTIDRHLPTPVSGLASGVQAVSFGHRHACALVTGGAARCWGVGPLGDGTKKTRWTPVAVKSLSGAQAIAAGGGHTCALLKSGRIKCWGENLDGQLGDGTTSDRRFPITVRGIG